MDARLLIAQNHYVAQYLTQRQRVPQTHYVAQYLTQRQRVNLTLDCPAVRGVPRRYARWSTSATACNQDGIWWISPRDSLEDTIQDISLHVKTGLCYTYLIYWRFTSTLYYVTPPGRMSCFPRGRRGILFKVLFWLQNAPDCKWLQFAL